MTVFKGDIKSISGWFSTLIDNVPAIFSNNSTTRFIGSDFLGPISNFNDVVLPGTNVTFVFGSLSKFSNWSFWLKKKK